MTFFYPIGDCPEGSIAAYVFPPLEGYGGYISTQEVIPNNERWSIKKRVTQGRRRRAGSSLVIHENPDDYMTDPSGKSGGRLACAMIVGANGGVNQALGLVGMPRTGAGDGNPLEAQKQSLLVLTLLAATVTAAGRHADKREIGNLVRLGGPERGEVEQAATYT